MNKNVHNKNKNMMIFLRKVLYMLKNIINANNHGQVFLKTKSANSLLILNKIAQLEQ